MSGLYCPFCGEEHTGMGKFCSGCGEDISEAIIEYKDKKLPIKLNNGTSGAQVLPEIKEKKYPTGSPLPKHTRAGRVSDIDDTREVTFLEVICGFCYYCT